MHFYTIFVVSTHLNQLKLNGNKKANVWKANLTNGLILGLIGIVYTLVIYFLDLTLTRPGIYVYSGPILIFILYFLLKSYRDNYLHGYMTYGQAFGAGVVIFLYYAIITAIFTYILYALIDPGLIDKQLAVAEELMAKKGLPQETLDAGYENSEKNDEA